MKIVPIVLEGKYVRLEPLTLDHAPDLFEAGNDDEVWQFLSIPRPDSLVEMQAFIQGALGQQLAGLRIPFAIIDKVSGKAAGTTSYLDIQPQNRGLEIGWTWLGKAYWRSAINTECKYLLLSHAFDAQGAIRVQLKTDSRNWRSQNAIERIGAKKEGVLRKHVIYPSGYIRDSVYFSIIDTEWPLVKERLKARMGDPEFAGRD
ncbi:MAG: GNAT family N-acetyltransferase [Chloroflexi bacterium]|nr:GNAT family N-acetyltransferase [Chloroflexota bacterium]OJV91279.1 MAG: GNAT family N-acetyltransferase [Chloroflexi bacterium 54-19]